MLRGEEPIHDQDGRIRYAKVLEFEDRETTDAFSHAVWEALEHTTMMKKPAGASVRGLFRA